MTTKNFNQTVPVIELSSIKSWLDNYATNTLSEAEEETEYGCMWIWG